MSTMDQRQRTEKTSAQDQQQDEQLDDMPNGLFPVEQLHASGIAALDKKKLKDAGLCTVQAVAFPPKGAFANQRRLRLNFIKLSKQVSLAHANSMHNDKK